MTKFYGKIGYGETVETAPGVYSSTIVERYASGDVTRVSRKLREDERVNPDLDLSVGNSISIVADAYANEHFHAMKYVEWAGALWVVSDITVERPRLVLRLGGVYNGPRPDPVTDTP
jgi:hypothetical protein